MRAGRKRDPGQILRGEKGESLITALYTILLLTQIFFFGIDIAAYTGTAWKLRNACSETLTLMKIENGFDSRTEEVFYRLLQNQGLDISRVEVSGTAKSVQRGEQVTIRAVVPYVVRSLRPFDKELRFFIRVEMTGLAQDYVKVR